MLQEPTADFNFNGIKLGPPNGLQGGSYFTKLLNNNEPLYLQIPKCNTKQGLVVTEKKKYCDLMFSRDSVDVISWFENIEKHVQGLLYEKKNIWFHDDLEESDIENAFTSPIRSYKSGQYYLVRCSIPKVISPETISCYNENEEPMDLENLNNEEIEIIPLVEIQGVKFSSKNFQIEIGLRQVMIIKKKEMFKNCLIKVNKQVEEEHKELEINKEEIEVLPEPVIPNEADVEVTTDVNPPVVLEVEPEQPNHVDAETEALLTNEQELIEEPANIAEAEFEEKNTEQALENKDSGLEEVSIETIEESEPLVLKNPSDVYYEMWRTARQKAREARKEALAAYLEAKKIKENYMLDGIDSESDEDHELQQVLE